MPNMLNTKKLLDAAAVAAFAAQLHVQNVTVGEGRSLIPGGAGGAVMPALPSTAGRQLHRAGLYRLVVLMLLVAGVLVMLPAAANATSPQL